MENNKLAIDKLKKLLVDISTKNESLNNENKDLNIKILSLIKLLKSKDNQISHLNKSLIKIFLKKIFLKKFYNQKQKIQKVFYTLKKINNNNNKEKANLLYINENNFFYPSNKMKNYKEIGIGDYKINQKFNIRKVSCLSFLKKRKYGNNEDENGLNNKDNKEGDIKIKLKFNNIEQQNEVNNICIKSDRNKTKSNPKYDFSVFNIEIIHKNYKKKFENKYLKSENIFKDYSILSERNNDSIKLEELEKKFKESEIQLNEKNKEKEILENEIINMKKENKKRNEDFLVIKNKMNEYLNKYNKLNNNIQNKKLEIIIDIKNKNSLNIKSNKQKIKQENEIFKLTDISFISNSENKKEKEIIYYNNENFVILAANRDKKIILKKSNFNINIFHNNKNNIINKNINLIICKENNLIFNNNIKIKKRKKMDEQYEVIEPMKYNIEEYKHNFKFFDILEISKTFNINYTPKQPQKNIINKVSENFSFNIINITNNKNEEKNMKDKIDILELKLRIIYKIKPKYLFFIKLAFLYHNKKLTESYKMFRNLLINLKLKILLKNKSNGPSNFYFLKYYLTKYNFNILSLSLLSSKSELLKNKEINTKLNNQIILFQETFKKYEESNHKEKSEKDVTITNQKNLIKDLNEELSEVKKNFEKMKLTAKDSASELISTSNESNKMKKIIEKLNTEIQKLQEEKILNENKIKNQQEVIKNLNEKMKKDQYEYEQNEIDVNTQIEKLKVQFDEYEKNIKKLNSQNISLKTENEKLKINNENLINNKEELISMIQESKNYEIENESLITLNQELKNNNQELNNKYINLKKEFDNLKIMSEESKNELTKAMNEMELYSELLQTLEIKVKEAENKKINAENERDKAINDVREIRQRYINIMGEKYA